MLVEIYRIWKAFKGSSFFLSMLNATFGIKKKNEMKWGKRLFSKVQETLKVFELKSIVY